MTEKSEAEQRAIDDAETAAFHAACSIVLKNYLQQLFARNSLQAIAGRTHEHRTLLIDESRGVVAVLQATFNVGDVMNREAFEELIEAAKRAGAVRDG